MAIPIDLLLVDGSSYLFRAYHALPPLTNSQGVPTGAMYGVLNMLKKLLNAYTPRYAVVLFDTKAKTFRHDMYDEYKANRPAMPEDLAVQIKPLHEAIQALGWPLLAIEGVEADDVIATLAAQAEAQQWQVIVSTGDKDLAQIVNDNVSLINTMTGERLDVPGVEKKFNLPPERITDYLALMGDSVDNVPGIPKVGPKTAVKWLSAYGDLAGVIAHAEAIKGKVGENLRANIEQLKLSHDLVKLKTDVALPGQMTDYQLQPPDNTTLKALYTTYEFKTWLKALTETTQTAEPKQNNYVLIDTIETLQDWVKKIQAAKSFAFDLETTSLDPSAATIVGIALAYAPGKAAYVPVGHTEDVKQLSLAPVMAQLEPLLHNHDITLIGQNLKYDFSVLKYYDIHINRPVFDTMLASYVINSTATRHDMDSLANYYLDYAPTSYETVAGKGAKQINFKEVAVAVACEYAAEDADVTFKLYEQFQPKLAATTSLQALYDEVEIPLLEVLTAIECQGVKVDGKQLQAQSAEVAKALADLEAAVFEQSGEHFNLGSPKQLQSVLYEKLKLPILEKTPKGQPSTAESVLQALSQDFELPGLILQHRSLSKLKSTYLDRLPEQINPKTGRIHTSYHQAVTATGRLSSSDPNLQNIPVRTEEGRKIRKAFIARPGSEIVAADYSQIELRIMAHLSADEGLLSAFRENRDIHQSTASEIFGVPLDAVTTEQRRRAKAINFGLIYGMSAFGLAKQIETSQSVAAEYIDIYFNRYPGVKNYMDTTREKAAAQGYVETLMGRRLYLPDIKAKQVPRRRAAERAAINAPMQGTAADIIKVAMIKLYRWQQQHAGDVAMIMQVHDELVFEVKNEFVENAIDAIAREMAHAADLAVPLTVGIGRGASWEEAH